MCVITKHRFALRSNSTDSMTALKMEICLNGVTLLHIDKTLISHPHL